MTQHPLTIPDGWTVKYDHPTVDDKFRDPAFYEGLVATVTTPNGHRYTVEVDGDNDLRNLDGRHYRRHPEFREAFPDGKLPEDGEDDWFWERNSWFEVYDEDGQVEDPDCVAHDVWEAVAQVFELPDPPRQDYVVTYESMPITATSPAEAIRKHANNDSGGGNWEAHAVAVGNPRLFRVLDLSTAHLPQEQMDRIGQADTIVVDRPDIGALVWVQHDDPEEQDARLIEDGFAELVTVLRYARTLGEDVYWVQFDRDADRNDALPTWEW